MKPRKIQGNFSLNNQSKERQRAFYVVDDRRTVPVRGEVVDSIERTLESTVSCRIYRRHFSTSLQGKCNGGTESCGLEADMRTL